ncbi:hypothetical protein F5Y18DRAFT_432177 [Xylariaceae sp. FL1019]|nr:hypothetical protein F5Y18DRAFT_432177 [Xylariaceae sp. FL1019]
MTSATHCEPRSDIDTAYDLSPTSSFATPLLAQSCIGAGAPPAPAYFFQIPSPSGRQDHASDHPKEDKPKDDRAPEELYEGRLTDALHNSLAVACMMCPGTVAQKDWSGEDIGSVLPRRSGKSTTLILHSAACLAERWNLIDDATKACLLADACSSNPTVRVITSQSTALDASQLKAG